MRATQLTGSPAAGQQLQRQQQQQPRSSAPHSARRRRPAPVRAAQQGGGFGEGVKRMAKQITGNLPVIGLISRWAATEGGVGNDSQAYPEFCRQVFDAAPEGFQIAVAELQNKYGKAAQRRYVLLALWMARHGAGVLPGKAIVDSARRLRISSDLEFEMDRFTEALSEVNSKYTYMERPKGAVQQQADVAVDALARLVWGLKDGQPIPEDDFQLMEDVATGGFWDTPGFREAAQRSIAERQQRASAYV